MKKTLLLPFLFLFLIIGCDSDDEKVSSEPLAAKELLDVAYGSDSEQKMDVYLPSGRNTDTKVILLLHGGSWVAGNKSDMAYLIPTIRQQFPDHAIVNINYRLAANTSPAFPKQINDIQLVIDHLKHHDYAISDDYGFIGFSAGGHLAMLYSYAYDTDHNVEAVCNVVGPADFTDPAYTIHPLYASAAQSLVGTTSPTNEQLSSVSPLMHITSASPATISFYGGQDPLVPASQGPRLHDKLDAMQVYNEFNFYANGGHADWDLQTMGEVFGKITIFLGSQL